MKDQITKTMTDAALRKMIDAAAPADRLALYNELTGKATKKFASVSKGMSQTFVAAAAYRDALPAAKPEDRAKGSAAARSESIAISWGDPDVRAARSTKHHVEVDGVWFNSVKSAFSALSLPMSKRFAFRKALKASPRGKLDFDGHTFKLIREGK